MDRLRQIHLSQIHHHLERYITNSGLFDDSIWYGGVITSVLKGGKRIKIKYDDGDVEESDYPDKDIVTDYGNTEESTLSSGEDSDELYSAEDMDIDDESTTMDFQDDAGTTDWNVEEDEADEEEAATSEETQVESVSSPQRLVPLDSLVSPTTNGRDWVDGETSQEIFAQDDGAINWSLDDTSAHSSINSGDKKQKRHEKNQCSDDDLSANSSIVSGEKQTSIDEAIQIVNGKAHINDPKHKDTSDDDGHTSFEVDDNSFGLIDPNLDSSDDLGAGDSDYSPIEEDNNTDKSVLDNRNQAALLLQSRTVQEVSTPQQAIPEYLRVFPQKDSNLPAHERVYNQQKDTGDESSAINILASQSQQSSSQNDHQGIESALMLLASSHLSKDDISSKDIQTAGKILTSIHKRPSSSEQLPSPKRPRLASDAATTLLAFAKQPIRFVVSTEV